MVNTNSERGMNLVVAALLAIALGAGFCIGMLMMLWNSNECCLHQSVPKKPVSSAIQTHAGIGLHTPQ